MASLFPRLDARGLFPGPPEGAACRAAHWTTLLIGGIAVTALVLSGLAIFLGMPSSRRAEPSASEPGPSLLRVSSPPRSWLRELTPAAVVPAEQARSSPPAPAAPRAGSAAPSPEPMTGAGQPSDRHLDALVRLTGAQLYQAFLSIGLLADSAENKVYTTAEAKNVLGTVMALLEMMDRQLAQVGEPERKSGGRRSLEQARRLTALLRAQAGELAAYWETRDREHVVKFHRAREEAWTGIKELLGLSE